MPAPPNVSVVRQSDVAIPSAQRGHDLDGLIGLIASQGCALDATGRWLACDLPPLGDGKEHRVLTADLAAQPPAIDIEEGWLAAGGAPIVTAVGGGTPRLAGGPTLAATDPGLTPAQYVETTWYAPFATSTPLFRLAKIRGNDWTLDAYDPAQPSPRWRISGNASTSGEPLGGAASPDGSSLALLTRPPNLQTLLWLDGRTGATRWQATLPAGLASGPAVSAEGDRIAVTIGVTDLVRMLVISAADGKTISDVPLPSDAIVSDATARGLIGNLAWFYRYVPAHRASEMSPLGATPINAKCAYEVYDTTTGKRVRTIDDASGAWAKLVASCQVRTLVPLANGHLAAIQVGSETQLSVVELDGLP